MPGFNCSPLTEGNLGLVVSSTLASSSGLKIIIFTLQGHGED